MATTDCRTQSPLRSHFRAARDLVMETEELVETDRRRSQATSPNRTSMRTGVVPELSVIVPTYNERDNIEQLIIRLDAALNGIDWEVIFVDDDSPDQTLQVVQRFAACDPRVRNILRVGRRGLA